MNEIWCIRRFPDRRFLYKQEAVQYSLLLAL